MIADHRLGPSEDASRTVSGVGRRGLRRYPLAVGDIARAPTSPRQRLQRAWACTAGI